MYKVSGRIIEVSKTIDKGMMSLKKIVIEDLSYSPPAELEFLIREHFNTQQLTHSVWVEDVGKVVIVWFTIESSKWKDKRFTNLLLKRIEF